MTTPTRPELKFDHDPRASRENCPSEKCAEKSRRLAWVMRVPSSSASAPPFEVLYLDVTDMHAELRASGFATKLAIFKPSDELIEALVLVATGEIARRQEA